MNVGILTFHHVYNYGALLQAYALQHFLESLGHSARIVDVRPFSRDAPGALAFPKVLRPVARRQRWLWSSGARRKSERFEDFRFEALKITRPFADAHEAIMHNPDIHSVVVGSDQVWNPRFGDNSLSTYCLANVDGVRKIAYAASVGSESVVPEQLAPYEASIDQFSAISVRDRFSVNLIGAITGQSPMRVVDPTLLVDWTGIQQHISIPVPERYIFYYGYTPQGDRAAQELKAEIELPVVGIGMETDVAGSAVDVAVTDAGPWEWLEIARRCDVIVTRSFHGLMFALSFRRPVVVSPANQQSSGRLVDILQRLGIPDVLIPTDADSHSVMERVHSVDWHAVYAILDSEVRQSQHYLREALAYERS